MPERRERPCFPDWAERERARDLEWIRENAHIFWPAARQGYEQIGRGVIVVDITQRPTGAGHPFGYFPEIMAEQIGEEEQRMVEEYDPSWEMVTVLLKPYRRVSTYRVGVIPPDTERQDYGQ